MFIELTQEELGVLLSAMAGENQRVKFTYLSEITTNLYKKLIDLKANNIII